MNPQTGEVEVTIGGQRPYVMQFTWAAVAAVQEQFGKIPDLNQVKNLAAVGAAGLRARHPEMTAERLMAASPPIYQFSQALQQAWVWAWAGPEGVAGIPDNPPATSRKRAGRLRRIAWPWRRG